MIEQPEGDAATPANAAGENRTGSSAAPPPTRKDTRRPTPTTMTTSKHLSPNLPGTPSTSPLTQTHQATAKQERVRRDDSPRGKAAVGSSHRIKISERGGHVVVGGRGGGVSDRSDMISLSERGLALGEVVVH